MADISKITLPSGTTYNLKDLQARADIENLQGFAGSGVVYFGKTTTVLSDGLTTATYVDSNGETQTATKGVMVSYNNIMYAWNGDQWDQLGSESALKDLAYKSEVSGTFTPAGTIEGETFTGESLTSTGSVTAAGSVSQPAFTGKQASLSVKGTPKGSVDLTVEAVPTDGTPTYTPEGTVAVTPTNTTVKELASSGTLPELTTTVADETLTIGFSQGTLPTSDNVSVMSGATASFTGTGKIFSADFTGQETESTGSYKPEGTVDRPSFTGSAVDVSVSGTPSGTISGATFKGTATTVTSK